ncbi:MAG: phosphoribosylaminoimidazolesuccinocarboxamide synthase, partial [Saprospiraceae bacterium]
KASEGHDLDISKAEILEQKIIDPTILNKVYEYTIALFEMGTAMARDKGLILVDTKYEFGLHQGEIILMDEIHTPDSSRYYVADGYDERLELNQAQIQLSKEFVREWLMHYGFQGREGELMPEMPDAFVWEISNRYIELYEKITGIPFQKNPALNIEERISINLKNYIENNFNLLK